MSGDSVPIGVYFILLATIAGLGTGILVWLVPVTAEEMTPAQTTLHGAADWMLKASIGAMLGLGGARIARDARGE